VFQCKYLSICLLFLHFCELNVFIIIIAAVARCHVSLAWLMDASSDVHHFTSTITREKCCSSQQNDTTTTASNQLQTDSYKVNPIPGSLFICYKFVGGVCTVEEVQVVIAPVGLTLQRSDLTQALVRVLEATVAYATLICTFYYYFILVWL